jgi:hypothetical protein
MSLGNVSGAIETGYVDFSGESIKTINLETASHPAKINLVVNETQNTSASPNKETDVPSRNIGNIQVSASWVPGVPQQFNISTSAKFYGRVIWSIISTK